MVQVVIPARSKLSAMRNEPEERLAFGVTAPSLRALRRLEEPAEPGHAIPA